MQVVPFENDAYEIGYHIGENFRSQGYATEAVTTFLPVIMRQLGIPEIVGICLADNQASARVMEHCGFTKLFQGIGNYQGKDREICRYIYI